MRWRSWVALPPGRRVRLDPPSPACPNASGCPMAKKAKKRSSSSGSGRKSKTAAKKVSAKARRPAAKKSAARQPATRAAPPPKWKPAGMHQLITNLVYKNAVSAIEFYQTAFGAVVHNLMMAPDGRGVWHAELKIGDSTFFLNDEMPQSTVVAPGPDHKPTATMQLYVPDCDAAFNRAVRAGARPGMPLGDMFWGDRMGSVIDPFGHSWMISTRVRELTQEQMRQAGEEFVERMKQQGGMQPPPAAPPGNIDH